MVRRRLTINQKDLCAMHNKLSTVFFCHAFILCSSLLCCFAGDTLTSSSWLSNFGGKTLVSAGKRFELGFFTLDGSSKYGSYVGIWYYSLDPRIVVWVANRNSPFPHGRAFVGVKDGNLQVWNRDGDSYWSTNHKSTSKPAYREAKLLDSGNLVFGDSNTLLATSLWQSFEHPTDTFLPGMKMKKNLKLISWKNKFDPKEGDFSFYLDKERNQFVIFNRVIIQHWTSGESSVFFSSERMPDGIAYFLSDPTNTELKGKYRPSDYNNRRVRLSVEGELQYWRYDVYTNWSLQWWEPRDKCSVLNVCGKFGSCNLFNKLTCKCLPGFEPKSPENWNNEDFSGGCIRSSGICGKNDTFLSLKMMRVGQPDSSLLVKDEKQCRQECLDTCQCQTYSFTGAIDMQRERQPGNNNCWIWKDDLKDLQDEYSSGGHDLFVRVAISDIESKANSCEPCGMNVIPYPLSTGSDCGDPMYFSFYCDNSTGKIRFETHDGTYTVTAINQNTRTFVIQEENVDACNASRRDEIQIFNLSFPFKEIALKPLCDTTAGKFNSNNSSRGLVEIDIGWEPPPEPVCTSSIDCDDWPNSTCNVTGNGTSRCLC